jgi:hypothetical protein
MGGGVMSNMYALYTLDMVHRRVPIGSGMPTTYSDWVLWENCPDGWSLQQCELKAARLETNHQRAFIVRRKLSGHEWSPVPAADQKRGLEQLNRALRDDEAKRRQKAIQKRISKAGMPPPKASAS